MHKLLLELIVNAARAAGTGSRVTLTLAQRERRAVLTLSGPAADDGRPLTLLLSGSDAKGRIPKPGEGAGTGLLLAQRIVALHGGTLMMERMDGMRSIVALPLTEKDGHIAVHTSRQDYSGGFSGELVALSDLLPDSAFAFLELE